MFLPASRWPIAVRPRCRPAGCSCGRDSGMLRLAAPFLQLILFAANFGLADLWFYRCLLAAQIVFYAAALGGHAHRHARHRLYVLTVPYALCVLNWAALVGFVRFLTGQQRVTWEQVASTALASPRSRSVKAEFRP